MSGTEGGGVCPMDHSKAIRNGNYEKKAPPQERGGASKTRSARFVVGTQGRSPNACPGAC
jgi:hypothetical protein